MSEPSIHQSPQLQTSLLRATLEATADGILVVDLRGHVLVCNERFLSMWAIPPALIERQLDEPLLDHVLDQLKNPIEFLRGVRELYSSEMESVDMLHFKDGRVIERWSRPQRVAGTMVGRVWGFHDVTAREQLLRNATVLSDATRLLASLDITEALSGLVRYVVPLLGEHCVADLWDGGVMPRRIASDLLESGLPSALHYPRPLRAGRCATYKEGDRMHLVVPIWVGSEIAGALAFVGGPDRQFSPEDVELAAELGRRAGLAIENSRLFEQAQAAVRARDEVLSTTAHEIRGPITSIRLAIQTLHEGEANETTRASMLDLIERADRKLTRFVDELMDANRLRTGLMVFHFEKVDLREVIQDVCVRLDPEITRSGSELTLRLKGELVGEWDRLRVDQIISNLLSNAITYGEGRPIDISAHDAGSFATVAVRDHGRGIPSNLLDAVFRPFERGAVATRHFGGLGLGLYIVRSIAVQLGGRVRIESKEGNGTTLVVSLPKRRTN